MKLVRLCVKRLMPLLLFIFLISFPYAIATEQQPPYAYVTDVNYPTSVNANVTFYVSVTVEYWVVTGTTGPITDFLVSINEADNRTKGSEYLDEDLAHVRDQLRQGRGTKTYDFTLTAPKAGKIWQLVAETYIWGVPHRGLRLFDKRNFNITILKTPVPLPTGPDILVNGGFESDFNGWERYSYGDGVANLSAIVVHQGNYSLATSSRLSPTRPDRPNGGGVYQVIERPDLSFDMNFSFWVYPMYVIRESTTDVRAWIVFHTNEKVFKIYYYISWHDKSALLDGSDVTFFLLENCRLGVWNLIERNLKSDFEAGFGASSQYRLLKIEVYLDLALHYFSMLCPFAYWDDVAITSTRFPPSTYMATVSIIGLPSAYSTHVMVDGASAGSIRYGESKSFEFGLGTSHTLTVDPYVAGPSGVRYYCSSSSSTFSSSRSHAFEYRTQYHLTVISKHGETKGSGWHDSGSTVVFSVAPSSIEMSGVEGALGARYIFDHWEGDSTATTPEATIIMDTPKSAEAVWRIDNTPLYLVALAIIGTLGIIVIVSAMVMRKQ